MSIIAGYAAIILVVLAVLFAASALLVKDYRDGSLQADLRWLRAYIRTEFAHWKHSHQH